MGDIRYLVVIKALHHHRKQGGQDSDNQQREHEIFHSAYLRQYSVSYGRAQPPEGLPHVSGKYLSEKGGKINTEIRKKLLYLMGKVIQIQFSGQRRQFHPFSLYFINPVIVSIRDKSTGMPASRIVTFPNSSTWAAMAWYPASLQSPAQNWQR